MNRIIQSIHEHSFAIIVFHVGVLLLSWPLLTIPNEDSPGIPLFCYLMIVWFILVVLLAITGYVITRSPHTDEEK